MNTSLIDHFITSTPEKIKLNDVLPCCEISDHDGPYIGVNARMERYQPQFKYIRDNSKLVLEDLKTDFQKLPFSIVCTMEDPENKLDIFNSLVTECIDRHAPIKRIKCTRAPTPWLKNLDIQQLIFKRNRKRYLPHITQKTSDWTAYRAVRNKLKHAIRTTKKKILTSALSDKRPRNIWRFTHRILKPKNQTITVNVIDLNKHFITTANRLLKSEHLKPLLKILEDILKTLESLPDQTSKVNFNLQYVTYEQVEKELKDLRLDCSAGYDNISVQHVKYVYENLVSPLTHIINSSISENLFPIQ